MQKVKSIKKRDGNVVPYDHKKLSEAIYKAAKAVGNDNRFVAGDLANVVTTYLERYYEKGIPTTEELQAMVEKILIETGNSNIAKAYIRYGIDKGKGRDGDVAGEWTKGEELFHTNILVDGTTRDSVSSWNRSKIASALVKEAGVSEDMANEIATVVEQKIFKLDNNNGRIPTSLIRELVNYELLSRGFSSKLRKQLVIGVPKYDIKHLIGVDGSTYINSTESATSSSSSLELDPERLCLTIGESTMRQYALQEIFSREVADAHLEGRIHIHNLEYPLKLYWLSPSLRQVMQNAMQCGYTSWGNSDSITPRVLTTQLGLILRRGNKFFSEGIELNHINTIYAEMLGKGQDIDVVSEAMHLLMGLDKDGFYGFTDAKPCTAIGLDIGKNANNSDIDYKFMRELINGIIDRHRISRLGVATTNPLIQVYVGEDTFKDNRHLALLAEICRLGGVMFISGNGSDTDMGASRFARELDGVSRYCDSWHSIGQAVTINLPQAFYRSEAGSGDFYSELDMSIDIAISTHIQKSNILRRYSVDGTFGSKLGWTVEGRGVLRISDFCYAVGFIGLNEVVKLLCDKEIGDDENSVRLALRILSYIYFKVKEGEKKYGVRLSLEDISNSDAADRCVCIDKEIYPRARGLFSTIKGQVGYSEGFHKRNVTGSNMLSNIMAENRFRTLISSGSAFIYANKSGLSSQEVISLLRTAFCEAHISRVTVI